jgi:hypothetical protein
VSTQLRLASSIFFRIVRFAILGSLSSRLFPKPAVAEIMPPKDCLLLSGLGLARWHGSTMAVGLPLLSSH